MFINGQPINQIDSEILMEALETETNPYAIACLEEELAYRLNSGWSPETARQRVGGTWGS